MLPILDALQQSAFAMFVKESELLYTSTLALHAIGLAIVVGISAMTALRVLGVAPGLPLAALTDFFPLMWTGFWLSAVTGTVLLTLYPTNYLLDFAFYVKLLAVWLGALGTRRLRAYLLRQDAGRDARRLAAGILAAWVVGIVTARSVAYPMGVGIESVIAFFVIMVLAFGVAIVTRRLLGGSRASRVGSHTATVRSR